MKITEYWARLVAAGLANGYKNVIAIPDSHAITGLYIQANTNYLSMPDYIDLIGSSIQLRKDGIDIYSLEWRKPTEQDVGKTCWSIDKEGNMICILNTHKWYLINPDEYKVLLADHGQIAPTEADFNKVYGG